MRFSDSADFCFLGDSRAFMYLTYLHLSVAKTAGAHVDNQLRNIKLSVNQKCGFCEYLDYWK